MTMTNEYFRTMTEAESAGLQAYLAPSTGLSRIGTFILAASLFGLAFRTAQRTLWDAHTPPWWLLVTAIVTIGLLSAFRRLSRDPGLRQSIKADLRAGFAVVTPFRVESAVEFWQLEDEGPTFLVKTKDGNRFIFHGQYLHGPEFVDFPWSEFEIVEAPLSRMFLGVNMLGARFPNVEVAGPLSWDQLRALDPGRRAFVFLDENRAEVLGRP